jgi:hypothetical protein
MHQEDTPANLENDEEEPSSVRGGRPHLDLVDVIDRLTKVHRVGLQRWVNYRFELL